MYFRIAALIAALAIPIWAPWSPAVAAPIKNVVITHGAFADASGWRRAATAFTAKGYKVTLVQQPLTSLQDDVAATKRILALQDGPTVLVGHSYGGMVVSDAGNDPKVAALVFVAAFQPEKGESLLKLAGTKPASPGSDPKAVNATEDGYLYLQPSAFRAAFAADVPKAETDFLANSQVFAAKAAFTAEASEPSWKTKPSWAIVATKDKSINPVLERDMAKRAGSKVTEIAASHAVYISQPGKVAEVIVEASKGTSR
jgi:pimeloyl-ACP methyl ester carboxylesterase